MRPKGRTLFAIIFGLPILVALPIAVIGAKFLAAGNVEVHVVEKGKGGSTVDIRVPASFVPLVMGLGTACRIEGCHFDEETKEALQIADAVIGAMASAPDGVLVDIRTPEEVVRIEKVAQVLRIHVDTPEEVVRASVPLGAVRSALSLI